MVKSGGGSDLGVICKLFLYLTIFPAISPLPSLPYSHILVVEKGVYVYLYMYSLNGNYIFSCNIY